MTDDKRSARAGATFDSMRRELSEYLGAPINIAPVIVSPQTAEIAERINMPKMLRLCLGEMEVIRGPLPVIATFTAGMHCLMAIEQEVAREFHNRQRELQRQAEQGESRGGEREPGGMGVLHAVGVEGVATSEDVRSLRGEGCDSEGEGSGD